MIDSNKRSALLQRAFGAAILSRDGSDLQLICPSCKKKDRDTKKRKLSVRLIDGAYHCWVCEIKGINIEFLFRKYAPKFLDEARTLRFVRNENTQRDKESNPDEHQEAQMPDGFIFLASHIDSRDPDVREAIRYCHDRGLKLRDLWYFKLGTFTRGSLRRRVVFPSFDAEGHLNYFTARSIDSSKTMKYINAKVSKKSVIFNDINIDWSRELTLVEGPFDLTKVVGNSTCLLGSHLSHRSALGEKIIRHRTPILLALDPDAREKSHNIAKMLNSYGIGVRTVNVPKDRDVGDMSKEEFSNLLSSASSWERDDRLLYLISNLKSGSMI